MFKQFKLLPVWTVHWLPIWPVSSITCLDSFINYLFGQFNVCISDFLYGCIWLYI